MKEPFAKETLEVAKQQEINIIDQFRKEVERLLLSGAVDREAHNRAMLFGVALENIADKYLAGDRKKKDYKNLKCF